MTPIGIPARVACIFFALGLAFAGLTVPVPARAHAPGIVLSGLGTATIDGVLGPEEWSGAGTINFFVGSASATLFVMNDSNNLYLAVRVQAPLPLDVRTSVGFEFDNDHDGVREPGDDAFVLASVPTQLFDDFRTPCSGQPPTDTGCAPLDTSAGGTTDGIGAVSSDGVFTIYEVLRPLRSGDDTHDFRLNIGDTVGFTLFVFAPSGNAFLPTSCSVCAGFFGDIVIASPVVGVAIDIKPGSPTNSINLGSAGVIPVAILSSPTFDATQVDPESVALAGATVRLIGKGTTYACSSEDVNGDGLLDLLCHVMTAQFMIEEGESMAVLEAKTFSGTAIRGEDSISIVPD